MYERQNIRFLYGLIIFALALLLTWRKMPLRNFKMRQLENNQLSIIMISYLILFYSQLADSWVFNRVMFNILICLFGMFILKFFYAFCEETILITKIKKRILSKLILIIFLNFI